MSLVYQRGTSRVWFWACAAVVSVGFHGGLSYLVLQDQPVEVAEQQVDAGITGAIMFDLSDLIAAPADMAEDSAEAVESAEAPTITESPEVVDPAKAADEPILSQIPYAVEDDSLKFGVASPDPVEEAEDLADEIATKHDPEDVDQASTTGAQESGAADASVAAVATEETSDTSKATGEGLTAEEKEAVREWQRDIVLRISKVRKYPPLARKQRIEGEVRVRFTLDQYGTILSSQIETSSGSPVLDEAALAVFDEIGKLPTPAKISSGRELHASGADPLFFPVDDVRRYLVERRTAGQHHRDFKLIAQQAQHVADAAGSSNRKPGNGQTSGEHRRGAKRQRLENIGATPDPAIHQHGNRAVDCFCYCWQQADGGRNGVERPATVIGDDDGAGTRVNCLPCIRRVKNAFHDYRQGGVAAQPVHIGPAGRDVGNTVEKDRF
jgi:protein TonB